MLRYNKYSSFKLWDEGDAVLRRENYNLKNEISKVKKCNNLLQQEKENLELKVTKLEHRLQNIQTFQSHRVKPQFPGEIEKILEKVESDVKTELYSKIEDLMSCITCVICHEKIKSVADCRHLVACTHCNESLNNQCPICRLNSRKMVIYH
jgi:hypothetical protein